MKTLIVVLLLILAALGAGASTTTLHDQPYADELGVIRVKVVQTGDPVFAPYDLAITYTCIDNCAKKDSAQPKQESYIAHQAVCEYRREHWNDNGDKKMTFNYSIVPDPSIPLPEGCVSANPKPLDLRAICAKWN